MEGPKELLENIIKSVIEITFSNKIEVEIKEDLTHRAIEIPKSIADVIGLKDGDVVRVKTEGIRALIFENVKVFVNNEITKKRFYINQYEAKATNLENGFIVEILDENEKGKIANKTKSEIPYRFEKDGIYIKLV